MTGLEAGGHDDDHGVSVSVGRSSLPQKNSLFYNCDHSVDEATSIVAKWLRCTKIFVPAGDNTSASLISRFLMIIVSDRLYHLSLLSYQAAQLRFFQSESDNSQILDWQLSQCSPDPLSHTRGEKNQLGKECDGSWSSCFCKRLFEQQHHGSFGIMLVLNFAFPIKQ